MAKTKSKPKAVQAAERIIEYFGDHRGIGHTEAIMAGAGDGGAVVIVATQKEAQKAYDGVDGHKVISIEDVVDGGLNQSNRTGWPLLIDNAALVALLSGLLECVAEKGAKEGAGK